MQQAIVGMDPNTEYGSPCWSHFIGVLKGTPKGTPPFFLFFFLGEGEGTFFFFFFLIAILGVTCVFFDTYPYLDKSRQKRLHEGLWIDFAHEGP